MDHGDELERFHPVLLYSILEATRRFEPDFYAHLCRTYHVDAERILGLFSEVEVIGSGQLAQLLRDLRAHTAYDDIVYLAGRNSLLIWLELHDIRRPTLSSVSAAFAKLVRELLPPFIGNASVNVLSRGTLLFIEIRDSVFARDVRHDRALCGFYAGFLFELGRFCGSPRAAVTETHCSAMDPDGPTCTLEVAL